MTPSKKRQRHHGPQGCLRRPLRGHPQRHHRQGGVLDVDALEAHEPVTVPRWYLGGHSFPEARDLPEHRDPNLKGYTVTADDRVTPIFEP
jgi:hypothetical protein